jgi:hypothetical protein
MSPSKANSFPLLFVTPPDRVFLFRPKQQSVIQDQGAAIRFDWINGHPFHAEARRSTLTQMPVSIFFGIGSDSSTKNVIA